MLEPVRITNHSGLSDAQFERAAETLRNHTSLHRILDWCQSQAGTRDLADLVVQDEFTHDIVIELEPGLFAVHDAT